MNVFSFTALATLVSLPFMSKADGPSGETYTACIFGDPHFATFDGLLIDCHDVGDFVYAEADTGFLVQGRQREFGPNAASVVTAFAVREGYEGSVLEATVNRDYYIGGEKIDTTEGYSDADVEATRDSIFYKNSGIKIEVVRQSFNVIQQGGFLDICISIPIEYAAASNVVGLLGVPDGDRSNDLQKSGGGKEEVKLEHYDNSFPMMNEYCRSNWCVKDSADSLFSYDQGEGFHSACKDPEGASVDLEDACQEHVIRCNGNNACLMDSIVFGFEAGQSSLQAQATAEVGKTCACNRECASGVCCMGQCSLECSESDDNDICPLTLEEQNSRMTCVAVIDENNAKDVDSVWLKLRSKYPDRPFCLLRPKLREDNSQEQLSIPTGFLEDIEHNIYSEVVRDFGQESFDTDDWYSICNLDESMKQGIYTVVSFIDDSGSTTKWDVERSMELFLAKAEQSGFNVITPVINEHEDYITPCLDASILMADTGGDFDSNNNEKEPETESDENEEEEEEEDPESQTDEDEEEEVVETLPPETQNDLVTCIAIIDENDDDSSVNRRWETLREKYPDRPFCLLQPKSSVQLMEDLSIPENFYEEKTQNTFSEVVRDYGDPSLADDWYKICNLDQSKSGGMSHVVTFIDNSGSLTKYEVQESLDRFMGMAKKNGFTVIEPVVNEDEDYITPCLEASVLGENGSYDGGKTEEEPETESEPWSLYGYWTSEGRRHGRNNKPGHIRKHHHHHHHHQKGT